SEYIYFDIPQDDWGEVTHALGSIAIAGPVSDGDTVTLDGKTYTFQAQLTNSDGNVAIEGSPEAARENLFHAIYRTGTPGVDYAAATTPHPSIQISEFDASGKALIRSRVSGDHGESMEVAASFTNASNMVVPIGGELDGVSPWR